MTASAQTDQEDGGPVPFGDRPESPAPYLKLSPLLALGQSLVWLLWHLSLIEYWKAAWIAFGRDRAGRYLARSVAIDSFMGLKWLALILLVWFGVEAQWGRWGVSYLIGSALFSYFYYHVWRAPPKSDSHAFQLRRTMTFLLSFFFGIAGYAYILFFGYRDAITWPGSTPTYTDALLMSLSNAFTASFADFPVTDDAVRRILAGEVLFVFAFLVIIVVNSVPSRN
ncbi:hypothetical protein [Pseudaestuariivita atlantica]|uniref:Potassium channel domain-containing protein n=1 Tax=Pseudaestuariivita atlantica TaxID=1317121 RepID=A0A0L1JS41_9RHOB|nr:hypothetical protein [Pseudaestuariivita atlantica]KNG94565.1 hypothetical protein ATO11_03915 [Pseudaestuariivita atlantica]